MSHRLAPAVLVVAAALAAPGCFLTRAVGLGPDLPPDAVQKGDPPDVLYRKAQNLFAAQEWSDAADAFAKVWKDNPGHELASDAQFYEAESRYGQGKYNGAFELYKRYLKDHPLTVHGPLIQRRIFDIGTYTIEVGQKGFLGVLDYSSEGVDYLEYLVSVFPHGDLADDALVHMADYEWRTRRFDDAVVHLQLLLDGYAGSEWALEGRLRLAKAYREMNRGAKYDAEVLKRSAAQYRAYIDLVSSDAARQREYAQTLAVARAELADVEEQLAAKVLESAEFYLKAGNADASRAELRNVIRDYPASQSAAEARRRLGMDQGAAGGGQK